jgi:hypothetical protein
MHINNNLREHNPHIVFPYNIQLPLLIKTPNIHSYNEVIHDFTAYDHKCQHTYISRYQRKKTHQKVTPGDYATAERGARFHPTVVLHIIFVIPMIVNDVNLSVAFRRGSVA